MAEHQFTLARQKNKAEQQEHQVDDEDLSEKDVNLERLKDLAEMDVTEQKEAFQLRFAFRLGSDGFRTVAKLADDFLDLCESVSKGTKAVPYSNVAFQGFLKDTGVYADDMEKMEVFKLILDLLLDDTNISFTQYLILYYRKMILEEYEKRWENISDEALKAKKFGEKKSEDEEDEEDEEEDEEEEVTLGDKLIEELFQPPLGVDTALDKAIVNFSEMLSKREQKITELVEKIQSSGRVKASQARTELKEFQARKQEEINKTKIYFSAAIMHVRKVQDNKFQELREEIEKEQERNLRPRARSLEELP